MLRVEMLPAGHGDALVVDYGPDRAPHQILIDAGTYHSWNDVRSRLIERRRDHYELFVVTHVDEDHIGGSIALLDDPELRHRLSEVWFNGYVHLDANPEPDGVLGPVQGEQLTQRLTSNSIGWNTGFEPELRGGIGGTVVVPAEGPLPSVNLPGGARLVLLSPTWPKLERMRRKWHADVTKAGLVPGTGDAGFNIAPSPWQRSDDEFDPMIDEAELVKLASKKKRDSSAANASSIAFVFEHDDKRVLFTGDANPTVLAAGLKRYGAELGERRPRIDLVKLSHHGSGGNLSRAFVRAMTADRFLLSTNADNFGHPDDQAVARLLVECESPTIYCNYRTDRIAAWPDRAAPFGGTFVFPEPGAHGLQVTV